MTETQARAEYERARAEWIKPSTRTDDLDAYRAFSDAWVRLCAARAEPPQTNRGKDAVTDGS